MTRKSGAEERLDKIAAGLEGLGSELGGVIETIVGGVKFLRDYATRPTVAPGVDESYLEEELARLEQFSTTFGEKVQALKGVDTTIPPSTSGVVVGSGGSAAQTGGGVELQQVPGETGGETPGTPVSGGTPSADAGTGTNAILSDSGQGSGAQAPGVFTSGNDQTPDSEGGD